MGAILGAYTRNNARQYDTLLCYKLSVQVCVIDSICMYPHCTVRIRLLYAFNKCFDFDFDLKLSREF